MHKCVHVQGGRHVLNERVTPQGLSLRRWLKGSLEVLAKEARVRHAEQLTRAIEAQRAIATLHSFRFFGLVFIVPGVVGPNLPADFAVFSAYGDLATGVLAMLALLAIRIRPLFWLFVIAFNLVGAADIIIDYYHGNQVGLPALAGELGATYAIPILYVPLLMITHVVAFYLLVRDRIGERRNNRVGVGG